MFFHLFNLWSLGFGKSLEVRGDLFFQMIKRCIKLDHRRTLEAERTRASLPSKKDALEVA